MHRTQQIVFGPSVVPDPNGLSLGQQTPTAGDERTIHSKKAAHTLPKGVLSMDGTTRARWRLSWNRVARYCFWAVFCRSHHQPNPFHSGAWTTILGRILGQKYIPKMIVWGSKTFPGNHGTPPGGFAFHRIMLPVFCRLPLAAHVDLTQPIAN